MSCHEPRTLSHTNKKGCLFFVVPNKKGCLFFVVQDREGFLSAMYRTERALCPFVANLAGFESKANLLSTQFNSFVTKPNMSCQTPTKLRPTENTPPPAPRKNTKPLQRDTLQQALHVRMTSRAATPEEERNCACLCNAARRSAAKEKQHNAEYQRQEEIHHLACEANQHQPTDNTRNAYFEAVRMCNMMKKKQESLHIQTLWDIQSVRVFLKNHEWMENATNAFCRDVSVVVDVDPHDVVFVNCTCACCVDTC